MPDITPFLKITYTYTKVSFLIVSQLVTLV
jgi:hypothetical protein